MLPHEATVSVPSTGKRGSRGNGYGLAARAVRQPLPVYLRLLTMECNGKQGALECKRVARGTGSIDWASRAQRLALDPELPVMGGSYRV